MQVSFIGHSFSVFTPAKTGDFLTKSFWYQNLHYVLPLNFFHQYTQLLTTLLFGLFFLIFHPDFSWLLEAVSLQKGTLILSLIVILCLFFCGVFFFWKKKFTQVFEWTLINYKVLTIVQIISVFKYLSFSLQYLAFLFFFQSEINLFHVYGGISIVYLLSSLIPVNHLMDVGVKTTWGVLILSQIGVEPSFIVFSTFMMWILNFAIPGCVGALMLLRLNIKIPKFSNYTKWLNFPYS